MGDPARIVWQLDGERRHPYGPVSPDPAWSDPIGLPPPWPDRPWIFGVMVASANGVVAWRRRETADDPVRGILGADDTRVERVADRRLMRLLRCYGDVGVGAETLREQPRLVQTPQEPGEPPAPRLYAFRVAHGLPQQPRIIVYSLLGRLPLTHPVFHTPGLGVIVVTGERGAAEIERRRGVTPTRLTTVVEPLPLPAALRRAHERLLAEHDVRYIACEGGMTVLHALRDAGLLDEVFLTTTDVTVDTSAHDGVMRIFDFEEERARLVGEGRVASGGRWLFRRWRFNER